MHECAKLRQQQQQQRQTKHMAQASMRAILNANYMAKRLEQSYPVLYKGKNGTCAHEFILDIRSLKESAGEVFVAKS